MLTTWNKLSSFSKFFIISLICAILHFTYTYAFEMDFADWKPKEETYDTLENIMYDVIEEKTFTIPITEGLQEYSIDVNQDGKISIHLSSGHLERLYITLDSDFNIIEIQRPNLIYAIILSHIIVFSLTGLILSLLVHIIYYVIKYIIVFIKFIIRKLR